MNLLSNNHHKNEVAVYRYNSEGKEYILKSALSLRSNITIQNEFEGHRVYKKVTGYGYSNKYIDEGYFHKILNPHFCGNCYSNELMVVANEALIYRLIEIYTKFIVSGNKTIIHGDFAFTNIVFSEEGTVNVFDWEHFHFADMKYWGVDFVHLLFLCIKRNRISNRLWCIIKEYLQYLGDVASNGNKILEQPFVNSKKYMIANEQKYKINIPIWKKFELANWPIEVLERYDSKVT